MWISVECIFGRGNLGRIRWCRGREVGRMSGPPKRETGGGSSNSTRSTKLLDMIRLAMVHRIVRHINGRKAGVFQMAARRGEAGNRHRRDEVRVQNGGQTVETVFIIELEGEAVATSKGKRCRLLLCFQG